MLKKQYAHSKKSSSVCEEFLKPKFVTVFVHLRETLEVSIKRPMAIAPVFLHQKK